MPGKSDAESFRDSNKKKAALSAATLKPSKEVWAVVGDVEYLTSESLAILKQRGLEWFEIWPMGEAIHRNNYHQFILYVNQAARLISADLVIVKDIFNIIRKVLGKDEKDFISVREFCHIHNLKEERVQSAIQYIDPDYSLE